ncbi:hypothetical protein [Thermoactinomyces sp. DSM 45892]|uniref:hypothetical protein n=1 Tax=Thermoactinomyces sp. DSM 45892 TaxID=1882753 RepID=UPI00089623E7|nr:hypothetical protein [Thermoactinomyces sp. DSM 45892]SDZ00335.1 hypothetical protein SAMN05444416_11191 [Thermoactinomyces sp. DSM 45892]
MGKAQRDKGARSEREFAKLIQGERVPLSGALGGSYKGDVKGLGLQWECKVRGSGFKQIYGWLNGNDALAVKADRQKWLAVLPVETLLKLLHDAKARRENGSRSNSKGKD